MTTLVINELLTYSFNRFDIDDAEDLRGTLSRYYGPKAITTAKVQHPTAGKRSSSQVATIFEGKTY